MGNYKTSRKGLQTAEAEDDFQEFHGSMVSLSQSVREMQDFRRAFAETVDQISEGISARVLSSLRAEAMKSSTLQPRRPDFVPLPHQRFARQADERFAWLSCQMEKQGEVHESIQITQRKIWNRLESMGATMEKEHKAAALQKQQMGQLSETQLRIQQDCQSLLELQHGVFQSFRSSSEKQGAEKENIFSSIGSEIQDLRGFVAQTLGEVGEGGFSAELRGLEQRLETWEAESLKSVAELRDELTRTELACTDRDRQVQELQRLHEDQKQRAEAVENRLETTQADLDAQLAALRDAHRASMVNSLKRLRDIESRGNIKVDRQFGRVALARALEFVPAAPPKEKGAVGGPASFGDAFEAEKVLEDFLEVVAMFDAPVQVGVGCKASKSDAAAWQDLAVKRAALIRDYLVSHGRPEDSVTVLGTAQPEVFLQLQEPNLFPPKAVKGKGKGRSASPKR
ncbi:unnamed protein product [Effrenium voratum]|nr:unnamed protein product [Effrenium voratum]